jgi:hypothetical protein
MRIFSKKALQFDHPKGADAASSVVVQVGSFASVPDWVAESTMFMWAKADGDVEVITDRESEIAAETGTKAKTKAEKAAEAKAKADAAELETLQSKAAELQIPDADNLDRDGLIAAIAAAENQQ